MLAGVHQKFKTDSDRKRQQQKLACGSRKYILKRDEKADDNADKQHDEHKARAAARMEAPLLFDVRYRQLFPAFIAKDGFVLRAVIFKGAADIGHERHQQHIADEDDNPEHALDRALPNAKLAAERTADEFSKPCRQKNENGNCEKHAEDNGKRHQNVKRGFSELLFQPLLKFSLFLLDSKHIRGIVHGGKGHFHRFDKGNHAADKRPAQGLMLLPCGHKFRGLCADGAVHRPHGNREIFSAAHHHALDHRLPADLAKPRILFLA